VVLVTQLLRIRRLVADQSQTRNAAAFLIDGDDRLSVAQIAQVIDQLSQLRRAFDIAAEKNKPTGLNSSKERGRVRIEFFAGNTGEYQLTKRITVHISHAD